MRINSNIEAKITLKERIENNFFISCISKELPQKVMVQKGTLRDIFDKWRGLLFCCASSGKIRASREGMNCNSQISM